MSEPASLLAQCRIPPEGVRAFLAARGPRVTGWHDWARLGVDLREDELASLDLQTGMASADFLRRLRDTAERPADWLCAYDAGTQVLTIGQTLFSDNWHSIVAVLAVLRRLGGFLPAGPDAQGLVLVHDWIFGHRGTLAAVALGAGGSGILATVPDAPARIAAALGPVRDAVAAGRPAPIRDDLDALAAGD